MQQARNLYLHVTSEQSSDYYPDNTASHFRVELDQYFDFSDWESLALVDFSCKTGKFLDKKEGVGEEELREIYIYCNFTKEQLVAGTRRSLLRYTAVKHDSFQLEQFQTPLYFDCKPIRSNTLEIIIKGADGKPALFLEEVTKCTFHLKKKKKKE